VKIEKNQSESRLKLHSEENATIQEEEVPLKKLEVTINRGHRQTKRRYRKRRERIIGQTVISQRKNLTLISNPRTKLVS
jgi:hypothetical protein